MTVKFTDRLDWSLAFKDVSAAQVAVDPPDDAQFQGGADKATIVIHYKLTTGPATLLLQFYNKEAGVWVDGREETLTAGQRSLKLDITGMTGGLRIAAVTGTLNWLYYHVGSRHTAGN